MQTIHNFVYNRPEIMPFATCSAGLDNSSNVANQHHHHQDKSDALSDHKDDNTATGRQSTGGVDPDEESVACYSADY